VHVCYVIFVCILTTHSTDIVIGFSALSFHHQVVFGSGMMKFPCPLLLTSIHFLVQWIFSWSVTRDRVCGGREALGGDRVEQMGWREYLAISLPCGLVTSGDVGLSNLSLVTLSVTFYTMVKASTPIFVLIWAYLFGIERITAMLLLVVAVISLGEFLTVMGEVDFHWKGFLLCLGASILSGARWTLVQLKIQSMDPPLKTTLATLRLLSPSMFCSMFVLSIVFEKPWIRMREYSQDPHSQSTLALGIVGAVFAIAMILCEFHLIMHASAFILMIGGVIKEMITIIIG
jgi:solute carrier family 35 protein C2